MAPSLPLRRPEGPRRARHGASLPSLPKAGSATSLHFSKRRCAFQLSANGRTVGLASARGLQRRDRARFESRPEEAV